MANNKYINVKNIKVDTATPDLVFLNEKEDVLLGDKRLGYTSKALIDMVLSNLRKNDFQDKVIYWLIKKNVIRLFMYFDDTDKYRVWSLLPVDKYVKSLWGWYSGKINDNRIYISINSVQKLNGTVLIDEIKMLMIHELMHFYFANFPENFLRHFINILFHFYRSFLYRYFNKNDISKDDVFSIVRHISKNELDESGSYILTYIDHISKRFKNESDIKDKINYMLSLLSDVPSIYNRLRDDKDRYKIQHALKHAYLDIQEKYSNDDREYKVPPNFVFQELLYVSEVIAVFSQLCPTNENINAALKDIYDNYCK